MSNEEEQVDDYNGIQISGENIKKNKVTKSRQAYKRVKKWRYEDQMGFLQPFAHQRETIDNLDDTDVENEEIEQENTTATETQENTTITEPSC
ncbi:hypothetical protein FQA39_LY00364 [Lamprigera yunnana]|nr:hypothetical protein FQA39_LY00364 [Lamprigera yunnana]